MLFVVVIVNTAKSSRIVCVEGPFENSGSANECAEAYNKDYETRKMTYCATAEVVTPSAHRPAPVRQV